jgi:hypothetical protein
MREQPRTEYRSSENMLFLPSLFTSIIFIYSIQWDYEIGWSRNNDIAFVLHCGVKYKIKHSAVHVFISIYFS